MDFIGIPSVICTNKDDVLPLQWPLDLHTTRHKNIHLLLLRSWFSSFCFLYFYLCGHILLEPDVVLQWISIIYKS